MQPENESAGQGRRSFIEEARRGQIVRAAIETIAEDGYAKASFARIARRAGISPGLITYHFSRREELIMEVMLSVHASMERVLARRAEGAASYAAALRALVEGFVRYCADHVPEMVAVAQIAAGAGDAAKARAWAERQREETLADLAEMFQEGQQEGELREFSPRAMAVAVLAALEATPAELLARPDTDVDDYAAELATAFELAVRRPTR
ncbi:TetR/AcrR family transcriptional regulator [Streptoalloteichus hindustanus]|uniref:Transcriptional regulator, TetR family n=1 Tax=Streptoalloteichus hindustanus TaxID=2017 RepID=A0A1M5ETE7_STRHI|nr:TetR/AcrR family transcriptional regulator [Streptoalloteichus hindustanus]SHF82487.1 transcriptional regulator, TetR family [Streptoalloteichus hindustanus]